VTLLNATLLAGIRGDERGKAEARLEELRPRIERLQSQGNGVTVTVVAEVPNSFDFGGYITNTGDPGQVVNFKSMEITSIVSAKNSRAAAAMSNQQVMYEATAPPHSQPTFVEAEMSENRARSGFHLESRSQSFPAVEGTCEFAKAYLPESIKLYRQGEPSRIDLYGMHRLLRISSMNDVQMIDTLEMEPYSTDWLRTGNHGGNWLAGRFTKQANGSVTYVIESRLQFQRDSKSPLIVEDVHGEDLDPQWKLGSRWGATIVWR